MIFESLIWRLFEIKKVIFAKVGWLLYLTVPYCLFSGSDRKELMPIYIGQNSLLSLRYEKLFKNSSDR